MRIFLVFLVLILSVNHVQAQEASKKAKKKRESAVGKAETPPPTKPPLQSVDIGTLPSGCDHFDLFLLAGQSNMKGRGLMPDEPKRDPRMVMMHLKDDSWYRARHPLHLVGDAKTFAGHDNAGIGPGLTFAEILIARDEKLAVGLVPCAVGGSSIRLWQKGGKLYNEAVRRAKLAIDSTSKHQARIRGILWLQGEANANAEELPLHAERLSKMIADFRSDLNEPTIPFIACTIGEMGDGDRLPPKKEMNLILLDLPKRMPFTACVDARDLKTHIGDQVHFDTPAQLEIGKRFAEKYFELKKP
jgi:Carbohydrate esterase, sialic acid-specific acetylesterase